MNDFGAYERLTMAEEYNRIEREGKREREREREKMIFTKQLKNDYTSSNYRE